MLNKKRGKQLNDNLQFSFITYILFNRNGTRKRKIDLVQWRLFWFESILVLQMKPFIGKKIFSEVSSINRIDSPGFVTWKRQLSNFDNKKGRQKEYSKMNDFLIQQPYKMNRIWNKFQFYFAFIIIKLSYFLQDIRKQWKLFIVSNGIYTSKRMRELLSFVLF